MTYDWRRVVGIVVPVIGLAALGSGVVSIIHGTPPDALIEPLFPPPMRPVGVPGPAADGDLIGASGIVEAAGQQIGVSTQVGGVVAEVFVTPGVRMGAGQPLFALDDREAQATVAVRRADLAAAEAQLVEARSRVPGLLAALDATLAQEALAEADEALAKDLLRRTPSRLIGTGVSEHEAVQRQFGVQRATAALAAARAAVAQRRADLALYGDREAPSIAVAEAAIAQARSALVQAETALDQLTVRARHDGTILQVNTRVGEYAEPGILPVPLMVMGRLEPLHLRVDIDEADIARYRSEAPAWASLRGGPRQAVALRFVRIDPIVVPKTALSGAGTERVDTRVLRAVYAIDADELPVYPGQQMDVLIATSRKLPADSTGMPSAEADADASQ